MARAARTARSAATSAKGPSPSLRSKELASQEPKSPNDQVRSIRVISKLLRSKFSIKNTELEKLDALIAEMYKDASPPLKN